MRKEKIKQNNKFSAGFTLVETLVAISIFTMSILGMMSILASSVSDTNYVKRKVTATYLAQEGIEYVRNQRDNAVLYKPATEPDTWTAQDGWDSFVLTLASAETVDYYPTGADFADYTRTISGAPVNGDSNEERITCTVGWKQGSGHYEITFSENLFNWVE